MYLWNRNIDFLHQILRHGSCVQLGCQEAASRIPSVGSSCKNMISPFLVFICAVCLLFVLFFSLIKIAEVLLFLLSYSIPWYWMVLVSSTILFL
jgi:hypothetical protein